MTEHKSPIEQALDLFFFAPLGLLMNADEVIPQLVERGRQQVTMARMFGQFAVQQGQSEAAKAVTKLQETVQRRTRPDDTTGPASDAGVPATQTSAPVEPVTPAASTTTTSRPQHNGEMAGTLAIPDYDSLSASQVVPRLESLSGDELVAVRDYEAAHRGRKTILNKIDQLQR